MQGFTALDTGFAIWDNGILMGNFYRRRSAFHAAHAAVAAQASFDPSLKPDSTLIADRQAKRPHFKALASIPADWDYIVLDVPFGKRGSTEVRQWAKSIGARWNTSHKEWRITASRVCSDRLAIINSLRLYLNHTTKAAPIFLARIGSPACKVFLSVPFEEKDTAKADGARWDTVERKWYFTMQGNLGSASFSQTIAKYEAKGWVDVVATEAYNAPHLGMTTTAALSSMREPNEQTAASKAFSLGATATKPVSYGGKNPTQGGYPTVAAPVSPLSSGENRWLSEVRDRASDASEMSDQWLLRKQNSDGSESWIRVHRIDGVSTMCISFRTYLNNWTHEYCDADRVRATWTDAVQNHGYTVYAHQRNTGAQLVVLTATGKWNPSNTLAEISAARDIVNDRVMGRRQSLP